MSELRNIQIYSFPLNEAKTFVSKSAEAKRVSLIRKLTIFLLIVQFTGLTYGQNKPDKFSVQKGTILLDLNFPYVNSFLFYPENENPQRKTGFLGFGLGIDYYTSNRSHLNLSAKVAIDFLAPVPAPVKYDSGSFNFVSTKYLQLTMNHDINKFHIGYGLVYGQNIWRYKLFGIDSTISGLNNRERIYNVAGLIGSANYTIRNRFYLSVIYRPTFIQLLSQPKFQYEHLLSFEFGWKIRVKK